MKVVIQRDDLYDAVEKVLDAVPTRAALPILSNILLEASVEGKLKLRATDLDISISATASGEVSEEGAVTVTARKFAEIVRELPRVPVSISVSQEKISISTSKAEDGGQSDGVYSLSGMPPDDFPSPPSSEEGVVLNFNGADSPDGAVLKEMISKTSYAASSDEARPVLCGVYWHIGQDGMMMVATDGARLVKMTKKVVFPSTGENGKIEAIVPPKGLDRLGKLLSGSDELKSVTIGQRYIIFDLGNTIVSSRLIEGPYVDYDQVIPKENQKRLVVSNGAFSPAVRRVSILSSAQTHQIRMSLKKDEIQLSATSQELGGEAREAIPAKYTDEDMELGYNASYLMEILRKIDSENIVFELESPTEAGVIKPLEQPDDEDYLCLIMPLRITS